MSKIFRLHEGASGNIEDWGESTHLSDHMIDSIKDPDGGAAKKAVTSIPTPFARMDLMRTAFKQVVTGGQPEGLTAYHKMVSDCLDIGEIFFNIEALKDQVEIISWDSGIGYQGSDIVINPASDLGRLMHSGKEGHNLLGETLALFIRQDTHAFNFDKLQRIYLLNYIGGGNKMMNIIGGTSPTTLFFASDNELSKVVDLSFGHARLFDHNYTPLFKRDPDFIKYIYSMKRSFPEFASRFRELNEYLEFSFPYLHEDLKQEIKRTDSDLSASEYQDIPVGQAGFYAEILGERLRTNRAQNEKIEKSSEFVIGATKKVDGLKPLVLPSYDFNDSAAYVKGPWHPGFRAPHKDQRPLHERTLPHHSYIKYPYLTVSDILEEQIIRLPYPINKEKYFNGYLGSDSGFALPLKKEFFRYFSVNDLRNKHRDGKRWFELIERPQGGVEAIVRIPVKGGRYIQLSRKYAANRTNGQMSPDHNEGCIVDSQFALTVYPFLKTGKNEEANYRVLIVDTDKQEDYTNDEFRLGFYDQDSIAQEIAVTDVRERSSKKDNNVSARYYILRKEFDLIELSHPGGLRGLMVPLFETAAKGASEFSFAIDFGTTNTHIEYKVDRGTPRPFEITGDDIQLGSTVSQNERTESLLRDHPLSRYAMQLKDLTPVDFLPETIGKGGNHKFPIRTVVSNKKRFDINQPSYALADFTIPFAYEKITSPAHIKITPHLKWSDFKNDPEQRRAVEAFIEELLMLIRNKVLLNGGNPDLTRIVWFYPSSMSEFRRSMLENAWHLYAKKHISPKVTVHKLSESVAPFYYFRNKEGVLAYDKPVVNIDIGGGTTDMVIFQNNAPVSISSFRFAADAIFGDGYGHSPAVNGFVQKYYPLIREKLINNELYHLVTVLEQIKESDSSEELIAFFFSLENNQTILEGNYPVSFTSDLKEDEDFKLVFLFFYASIIYHLARLMKAKDLHPPRHLLFSGMGSKVLNIIDTGIKLRNLTEFTNLIFGDVYGLKHLNIELKQYEEPKEITCKGGLLCQNFMETDHIKDVLIGTKQQAFVDSRPVRYSELENGELLSDVLREVSGFIDKFFAGNDVFHYPKKFGVNPVGFAAQKLMIKEDIMQYLIAGVKEKMEEEKDNMELPLEETLFFYPLRGVIHRLAQNILNTHQMQKRITA